MCALNARHVTGLSGAGLISPHRGNMSASEAATSTYAAFSSPDRSALAIIMTVTHGRQAERPGYDMEPGRR